MIFNDNREGRRYVYNEDKCIQAWLPASYLENNVPKEITNLRTNQFPDIQTYDLQES